MDHIYLSRRNLLTLLAKLDRNRAGGNSAVTLIKRDVKHPTFPQTLPAIAVTAIEDDTYYDRPPGDVLEQDEPTTDAYLPADVLEFLKAASAPYMGRNHDSMASELYKKYKR